jgi:hypothetical protein
LNFVITPQAAPIAEGSPDQSANPASVRAIDLRRDFDLQSGRDILAPPPVAVNSAATVARTATVVDVADNAAGPAKGSSDGVSQSQYPGGSNSAVASPGNPQPAPAPQLAGLLTEGLSVGWAALKRTIKNVIAPTTDESQRPATVWSYVRIASLLVVGGAGYIVVRRHRRRPALVYTQGLFGVPGLPPEDVA